WSMHTGVVLRRGAAGGGGAGAPPPGAGLAVRPAAAPAGGEGGGAHPPSSVAPVRGPLCHRHPAAPHGDHGDGGLLGGRLEIIFRDDGGTPTDAVRVAEELLTREGVAFLAGTFLSNVGLAVADFANQKKTLFIATEPLTDAITMGAGNRYTF